MVSTIVDIVASKTSVELAALRRALYANNVVAQTDTKGSGEKEDYVHM